MSTHCPGSEPSLESLRAEGLHHQFPLKFRHLEALAARMPAQPPAVQQLIAQRLQARIQAYVSDLAVVTPGPHSAGKPARKPSPLALLNRELAERDHHDCGAGSGGDGSGWADLKSVRQFGEVWSRVSADAQVARALDRGPDNAGPLNSHKLMLRSLGLMRELSPDYLRRFLANMDALLWLEQEAQRTARPVAKSPRGGRRKS